MSFDKPWGNYLLDAIVETKAPNTVSFLPQTIAWQVIFIVLILLIINKAYKSWKNYQANAYRREALAWLANCSLLNEDDIRQLPALLRKTANIANQRLLNENNAFAGQTQRLDNLDDSDNKVYPIIPREVITNITGKPWVLWLDQHCSKTDFDGKKLQVRDNPFSCEKLLTQLAYIPKIDITDSQFNDGLKQLTQQIELWITHHELSVKISKDLNQDLSIASEQITSGEKT